MSIRVSGRIRWREYDAVSGKERRKWEIQNMITSGGLSMLRDYLIARQLSLAPSPPLYVALGSGLNTNIGRFHYIVPGETFRTEIVSADADGTSAIFHFFLNTGDDLDQSGSSGNVIACYGLYAGEATAQADTGTLFAIAAETGPFSKDPNTTYSGDWTITISGTMES